MDRERLKQVQQTDLTDSRVNEDFVDWLKNKAPTYLLVILVALVAVVFFQRWREGKQATQSLAFAEYDAATEVGSLQMVWEEYEGVGSVSELAKLRAADSYYSMMLTGFDPEAPEAEVELTDEQIDQKRTRAAELYRQVLEGTKDDPQRRLFAMQALFGLAAVAESQSPPDLDEARSHYQEIVRLAEQSGYAPLAEQAKARMNSMDTVEGFAGLPSTDDLPPRKFIDPLLEGVFENLPAPSPDDADSGDADEGT